MSDRKMTLGDILRQDPNTGGLPHVTRQQIENLQELLDNDLSMYEEFFTLVKCGLEEYQDSTSSIDQISEKVSTCLLLIVTGAL